MSTAYNLSIQREFIILTIKTSFAACLHLHMIAYHPRCVHVKNHAVPFVQLLRYMCLFAVPNSLLFLGRPGVGKTTVIREMARVLSDELHKRVVIVDTSNEIGGDGDVPHPAIGGARRMQVPDPSQQHRVMVSPDLLYTLSPHITDPQLYFAAFTNCSKDYY